MAYGGSIDDGGARAYEDERNARIAQGREAIDRNLSEFDDSFYAAREADYTKFALPQFTDQMTKTRNSLAASLARRGLLTSTAAIEANTDLDKYAGQKQREIADAAAGEANKLRSQVENQRSELTGQLLSSADPLAAGAAALSSAETLRRPSGFASLGNLFSDWTANWQANQVARSVDPSVPPLFSFGGRKQQGSISYVN